MAKRNKFKGLNSENLAQFIETRLKRLDEKWKRTRKRKIIKPEELEYEAYEVLKDFIPYGYMRGNIELRKEIVESEHLKKYLIGNSQTLYDSIVVDIETIMLNRVSYIFIFGAGRLNEDGFRIHQIILLNPGKYEEFLEEIRKFFKREDFKLFITYNGDRFDIPFIMKETGIDLSGKKSFDLLVFSKRFFERDRFLNRRLVSLSEALFSAERDNDISPYYFKTVYMSYLDRGDREYIEPVIKHNREDIIDTLFLIFSIEKLIKEEKLNDYNLFGLCEHLCFIGEEKVFSEVFSKIRDRMDKIEVSKSRKRSLLKKAKNILSKI